MAAALYGTVLGSMLGGWPTDRFGRKATLLWIGLLYLVSAPWGRRWRPNVYSFIVARAIGGLGIGISTVAAPLYISEIAPPEISRTSGRHVSIQHRFRHSRRLSVQLRCWPGIGENAWRWMLGVAAFPSLLYTVFCLGIPESPRWLLGRKGDRAGGHQSAAAH